MLKLSLCDICVIYKVPSFSLELFQASLLVICMCACIMSLSLYANVGRLICDGMRRRCRGGQMLVRLLRVFAVVFMPKYHNEWFSYPSLSCGSQGSAKLQTISVHGKMRCWDWKANHVNNIRYIIESW